MIYDLIKILHFTIGICALVCYWLAALSRKGSALHKRAGKVYLVAMAGILLTGTPLAVALIVKGRTFTGSFLCYVVVITTTSVWLSWRAIRDKNNPSRFYGTAYRILAVINLITGGAVLLVGISQRQILFAVFSLIGLANGIRMLRTAGKVPKDNRWWLHEHLRAMGGNGIATHIAFALIGLRGLAPQLPPDVINIAGWLAPLVVGLLGIAWTSRKYLRKSQLPVTAAEDRIIVSQPR